MSFGHQGARTTKKPAVSGRLLIMVELRGIEPLTSWLPAMRSPS